MTFMGRKAHESMASKRFSPAAERNRDAILGVLREVLPPQGAVLEVASGTGQHARHFAEHLPSITWIPTDVSPDALQSIEAWSADAELQNLQRPRFLDVLSQPWPIADVDAVLCSNMIHITPWECTVGLFAGAAQLLDEHALLITYGPYRLGGRHTAASNAAFDQSLRATDRRWGVRDVEDLIDLAATNGFALDMRVDMPANNMTLVWSRLGVS